MNRRLRRLIDIVLIIFLLVGFWGIGPGSAQTQDDTPTVEQEVRTVTVSGRGDIQARPDTAVVQLGVQTDAETAQGALEQNSTQMQAVVSDLEDAGIESDNIQTQTIQLSPRYQFDDENNERTLIGYTAANFVEVRTDDLGSLGEILDSAVSAGANTINSIRFEVSDTTTLIDEARQAAVESAREKAEQLASLTNTSLGSVLNIHETSGTPLPAAQRQVEFAAEAAAVPVEPGSQTITVNVQVSWMLVDEGE